MQVAELFVNLGVKGSEKTVGAITGMKAGLKETASTSLEAKAAIIGAMYALERLFASSNRTGTDLTNFTAVVGMSAKTLQQYQYAARQVGISNEAVGGTFKSLQAAMAKTLKGEGAPAGLGELAKKTGAISDADIEEWARKPELLLQRLQQYAKNETNDWLRNETIKSFGVGDDMIAGLARQAFTPGQLAKAPTYSDAEIANLDKANAAWSNLGTKIEMAVGHFNAKHGTQLVDEISGITDKVILLVNAFQKLAEKAELFKWLGKAFEGWQKIFEGLTMAIEFLNKQNPPDVGGASGGGSSWASNPEAGKESKLFGVTLPGMSPLAIKGEQENEARRAESRKAWDELTKGVGAFFLNFYRENVLDGDTGKPAAPKKGLPPAVPGLSLVPAPPPGAPAAGSDAGGTTNVNVQQTLNFAHPGVDASKTGQSVKDAARSISNQLPSRARGS